MNAVDQMLDGLEAMSFRAEIDSISSKRTALLLLQEHDVVRRLAAALCASPGDVGRVLVRMRNLVAHRPQDGTVHDYDATLAACAVAILMSFGALRPLIEAITLGADRTLWLEHALSDHRRGAQFWPSIRPVHSASADSTVVQVRLVPQHRLQRTAASISTAGTSQTRVAA